MTLFHLFLRLLVLNGSIPVSLWVINWKEVVTV